MLCQVFKTESKGWGVRCAVDMPVGAVLCAYIGSVVTDRLVGVGRGRQVVTSGCCVHRNYSTATVMLCAYMLSVIDTCTHCKPSCYCNMLLFCMNFSVL